MTARVIKLDFDTRIFKFPCGRIEFGDNPASSDEIDRMMDEADHLRLRHLVARVPAEWAGTCTMLKSRGFRFAVCSVSLQKELDSCPADTRENDVRPYQNEDDARLVEITLQAFQSGTHFHSEPLFTRERIDRLHTEWIRNLIADETVHVFAAHCPRKITGYVTIAHAPGTRCGHIGLIAVDPQHQGEGIGRSLLHAAEQSLRDPLQTMTVMTEQSNTNALHLYTRSGYTVRRLWTVLHATLAG